MGDLVFAMNPRILAFTVAHSLFGTVLDGPSKQSIFVIYGLQSDFPGVIVCAESRNWRPVAQKLRRLLFHMFCSSFAGGFSAHAFLKSTCTGFGGGGMVQAVGAVLRPLVSPQRCTSSCFDVCLICALRLTMEPRP